MESLSEHSAEEEWEVEKILKERTKKTKDKKTGRTMNTKEYLVKWIGYEDPTWEPEENLENCQEILKDFLLSQIMKKLKSEKKKEEKDKDDHLIYQKKKIFNNKKRSCPDTPGNITDDDQEKSSSTVCNSISKSHDRENKKKKTEKVDDEKIIEIDLNYDIEIEKKEKPKSEEKRNKEEMLDIVIKNEKDEKDVIKDFSGIKVKKINYMKIPENPNDGISFNIKFKKQGKTFIENFNTKNDSIPNECLAKYYEMFIRENFKGCTFSKEMLFE